MITCNERAMNQAAALLGAVAHIRRARARAQGSGNENASTSEES